MTVKSKYGWVKDLNEYHQLRDAKKIHSNLSRSYQNVQALMDIHNCVIVDKDDRGWTYLHSLSLHEAVENEKYSQIKELLAKVEAMVSLSNGSMLGIIYADNLEASGCIAKSLFESKVEKKLADILKKEGE